MAGLRFVSGILSLFGAGVSKIVEDEKKYKEERAGIARGYNFRLQNEYEADFGNRINHMFDHQRVFARIKRRYPNMYDHNVYKVYRWAITKRVFEEETGFTYEANDAMCRGVVNDLDSFTPPNTRYEEWVDYTYLLPEKIEEINKERAETWDDPLYEFIW